MSEKLPHLTSGWNVDQAIVTEEDRVVVIRFGSDDDLDCMQMDKSLSKIQDVVRNFAVIYVVDCVNEVTDFNTMYELTDPMSLMFFYHNKHITIDAGTGDNNKLTKPDIPRDHLIDIIEEVYVAASKGRGQIISPHDYSSGYRF